MTTILMRLGLLCLLVLVSSLWAAVKLPRYTVDELSDSQFVNQEIARQELYEQQLRRRLSEATPILRVTLEEDLKKIQYLLEALRYVKTHGFRLDDTGLGQLVFFQRIPVSSKIILPAPQVRTAARISVSTSGPDSRISGDQKHDDSAKLSVAAVMAEDPGGISRGEEIDLKRYLVKGQTVIFDFFSVYCAPCRQISPLLDRLDQQRPDVTVVKVNINRPAIRGIDWQSPVVRQFDLHSIPHLVVYGPDGTLQAEGSAGFALVALLLDEAGIS